MTLEPWQWACAFFAAFLIGFSKTGLLGVSLFSTALFALMIPARESVGVVLPILITADLVAITTYREHANWSHVWRLIPWTLIGIVLGYFALSRVDNAQVEKILGILFLVLVALQFWQSRSNQLAEHLPHTAWFAGGVGIIAGFSTMIANAGAPIMTIYLLAMRFNKIEFVGTAAWYFFILNLIKVPFSWSLGLINGFSLPLDLAVAPFAIAGALVGRRLLPRLDQKLFERIVLLLTLVAALKLLF